MAEPGSDLRVRTLGTSRRARCTQRRECSTLEVSMGYCARRAVVWVSSPAAVPQGIADAIGIVNQHCGTASRAVPVS